MTSAVTAYLGGVATVVVALGVGFGGGVYLTGTLLLKEPIAQQASKQDAANAAREAERTPPQAAAPVSTAVTSAAANTPGPAPAQPSRPSSIAAGPLATTSPSTSGAGRDDAAAAKPAVAQSDDEPSSAKAQRKEAEQKAAADRKSAERRRKAERRRQAAERIAAGRRARSIEAAELQRQADEEDATESPRRGFASDRRPGLPGPGFFGIRD